MIVVVRLGYIYIIFFLFYIVFSARCNIYISCLCYDVSVHLSVTEVHRRIMATLGFEFRSKFTVHAVAAHARICGRALRVAVHAGALWSRCMPERGEWSSRAMLAIARPSCLCFVIKFVFYFATFSLIQKKTSM